MGLTGALLQSIDFMCCRHLPLPQHRNHKQHTQSCSCCHSSKSQSPGGCRMHSRSCGERHPNYCSQWGTGVPQGLGFSVEKPQTRPLPLLGCCTHQGHPWLCPVLAHPGGKSLGLCWRHGKYLPEKDPQHSFYPLQSNVKVGGKKR